MSEKKEIFFETVFKDEETAQKYLEISPEEIATELKAEGLDYSVDEIKSYGEELQKMIEKSTIKELDEKALDDVSGGTAGGIITKSVNIVINTVSKFNRFRPYTSSGWESPLTQRCLLEW